MSPAYKRALDDAKQLRVELLPPEGDLANWLRRFGAAYTAMQSEIIEGWVRDYARANVEHHTAKLRADAERWERAFEDNYLAEKARVERLEGVLRQVQQKLEEMAMIRGGHGTLSGTYLLVSQVLEDKQGGHDGG